ncbi:tetratricopeptide repeat protein [Microcoleus sp. FACHB-1515]|uniref:tetratricopeptide repeat protein n=1 Tax=Cyanophyceae TaxID=3028117 RepID=UPI0016881449|nr:tetratricopeptide repeat protein [Microcoleus sp. FACHB-1515]MBD2091291.1 tetratricopeptide repeat protein [Microcoleus sp. FACHB-1515]
MLHPTQTRPKPFGEPTVSAQLALSQNNSIETLVNLDRFDEALAAFNQAVRIDPQDAAAWYRPGWVQRALGQYEAALASLKRSISLNPDNAWA